MSFMQELSWPSWIWTFNVSHYYTKYCCWQVINSSYTLWDLLLLVVLHCGVFFSFLVFWSKSIPESWIVIELHACLPYCLTVRFWQSVWALMQSSLIVHSIYTMHIHYFKFIFLRHCIGAARMWPTACSLGNCWNWTYRHVKKLKLGLL